MRYSKKSRCPQCGAEYDVIDEAASRAINKLCAACWCARNEKEDKVISDSDQKIKENTGGFDA
jgi:NMD protein affecting ribosome stability and mRNA decay